MAQIDTLTNVGAVVSTDLALILRGGANVLGTFGSLVGQNATAVTITGGTVNGTVIGGTTAAAGNFTTGAFSGGVDMASTLAVATRLGIGVAAHASAALNITTTDQHIRLNNGSEIAVIELDSDGELNIWAHGDGETINLKTGSGAGTNVLSVVGSNVILPDDGYFLFGDGTSGIQGNSSSDFLKFYTANIETLVLGSTGAATFSSSATADWAVATINTATSGAGNGLYVKINDAAGTPFRVDNQAGAVLTIAPSTGAATFSGNVGIGRAPSSVVRLSVAGVDTGSSNYAFEATNSAAATRFVVRNDGLAAFYKSDNSPSMTLDASGNLGLGAVPSAWAGTSHGSMDFGVTGAVNADLQVGVNLSQNMYWNGAAWANKSASYATSYYNQSNDGHEWYYNTAAALGTFTPTRLMKLDASGNLLVGTTTATARLIVDSALSAGETIRADNSKANYSGVNIYSVLLGSGTNSASCGLFQGYSGGTVRFLVAGNGAVYGNGTFGTYSDLKLKENIVDANSQWDDIKAVQLKNYSMKEDSLSEANQLGVIAQDLEASGMQKLIEEMDDKDVDGNLLGTTTKHVKYSVLHLKALGALQEAMTRIETLEARLATLEGA